MAVNDKKVIHYENAVAVSVLKSLGVDCVALFFMKNGCLRREYRSEIYVCPIGELQSSNIVCVTEGPAERSTQQIAVATIGSIAKQAASGLVLFARARQEAPKAPHYPQPMRMASTLN